jgi:hypothetical protein
VPEHEAAKIRRAMRRCGHTRQELGQVDHLAAETARAASLVHDALAVRRGIRELPRHDQPLVAALVA